MQEQKYHYIGDPQKAVDAFANKIDELPYDVLFTQFEGQEEVFFSFSMEAYDEELEAIILSMISLMIYDGGIKGSAISNISNASYGQLDSLALVKQTNMIANMFLDSGFEIDHEHDHETEDECDCDSEHCDDPNCNCHHIH